MHTLVPNDVVNTDTDLRCGVSAPIIPSIERGLNIRARKVLFEGKRQSTTWVTRILYENNGEKQDQEDLEGIAEDCISGWPYLEKTIADIKTKL
jgi:hypothetical protein